MADPSTPRPGSAPRDRREPPGLFGLGETARRVGHYRWVEMRLFEALGGWVATVPEIDAKTMLARHANHHAWHAELWTERLPELRALDADELTEPPNAALRRFVEKLAEPEDRGLTVEKLVGAYRVLLPHKIAAYTFHRSAASSVADAPLLRSLDFVLQDETSGWTDGEMLLQRLIGTPEEVERAARWQAGLEALLVEAGGIAGPGTIGAGPARDGDGATVG